jgi:hypothetical protein
MTGKKTLPPSKDAITASTPIACRACPLAKPLWSRLAGAALPGGRMKCISLEGICKRVTALVLVLCACCLLGCGGEIDPAGAVRAENASSAWVIGRRGY